MATRLGCGHERLGLSGLAYPVPPHANQIGCIPVREAARGSVLYVERVAPLGDWIRGIHFWRGTCANTARAPRRPVPKGEPQEIIRSVLGVVLLAG